MLRSEIFVNMLIVFVLVILCQDVYSFQCDGDMVGSCQCSIDKRATYQLHCPSYQPDKKKLTMLVKAGEFAQVSCVGGATSEEVFFYLKQLQVGKLHTLKFKGCPFPIESYQQTMEEMGVSEVQRLYIYGVPGKPLDKKLMRNLTVILLDLRYSVNVDVDADFFKNSTNIQHLYFNGIRGLTLKRDSFNYLPNITNLGISSCGISSLDADVFKNITTLQNLNLHGNDLKDLPGGIFDNLTNLTKLNLGSNKLRTLPDNVFLYNNQIEEAILSFNCFESLPEYLFAEKQKLGVFDFRRLNDKKCENKSAGMELPGTMFQNSAIKEIKFLHIDVDSIPENFLRGCKSLKVLIVQSGSITKIPLGLFKDNPIVEKIDFVNNVISELDVNTFKGLTKLTTLRLNHNNISSIVPEMFTDLTNVKTLHISQNNIEDFSDNLFELTPKLEELDLSNNKLIRVHEGTLKELLFLKKMNMNNNLITSFDIQMISRLKNLRNLDLSDNNISGYLDINSIDTTTRSADIIIDLSQNKLERVLLSKNSMTTKKVKFLLINNPLVCDCYATEIKQMNTETKIRNREEKLLIVKDDFVCANNKTLYETLFSDLNCPFPSEILNEDCPQNCTCNLNRYSRRVTVNCSGQALTQIPINLPTIPGESEGIILHMENNFLTNLTDSLQRLAMNNLSNFDLISELHLSGNKLKYVDLSSNSPNSLEYLALDNNKIQSFSNETLQYFLNKVKPSNLSLKLGNNPYDCNCNSLELLHFLKMSYSHVEDYNLLTIKCLDKEKQLFIQNEDDFCHVFSLITALVPAIFLFIILFFLLILHIFYKETIMIYVFSKSWGKIFFSEDQVDKNKPHDAFLSYSHHDAEFVEKTLLPGLESEDNPKELQYKCLIHTRDWNVGDMISDQIIESVESSRRTVIVLSRGYIQSMWTRLEFKAAHTKAMKENTQRVIIILHGEKLDKEDLDEDLQKYLKTNTYIESNDPWFWKKLRYALPKKSYKQKKPNKLPDKSKDRSDYDNAKHKNIHDISGDNPNKNKVQLPYYKQFSRELLLTSESLKRDLGGNNEYIV